MKKKNEQVIPFSSISISCTVFMSALRDERTQTLCYSLARNSSTTKKKNIYSDETRYTDVFPIKTMQAFLLLSSVLTFQA